MRRSACLALLLAWAAAPSCAKALDLKLASHEQMAQDISEYETDLKEAEALVEAIRARRDQVADAADLEALAEAEKAENARLANIVDGIYLRRSRFRVQAHALQVGVVAAQLTEGRGIRPRYDKAIVYREATERMGRSIISLQKEEGAAHSAFLERLALERSLRRKARLLRRFEAAALAVMLLVLAAHLVRRARKPQPSPPPPPRRPDPRHRPEGPARLQ